MADGEPKSMRKMPSLTGFGGGANTSKKRRALSLGDSKAPAQRTQKRSADNPTSTVPMNDMAELVKILDIGVDESILRESERTGGDEDDSRFLIKQGDVRSVVLKHNVEQESAGEGVLKGPLHDAALGGNAGTPGGVETRKYTGVHLFLFNDMLLICKSPSGIGSSLLGQHKARFPLIGKPIYCNAMTFELVKPPVKDHNRKLAISYGDYTATIKFESREMMDNWLDGIQGAVEWLASISKWSLLTPARREANVRVSVMMFPKSIKVEDMDIPEEDELHPNEDPIDRLARLAAQAAEHAMRGGGHGGAVRVLPQLPRKKLPPIPGEKPPTDGDEDIATAVLRAGMAALTSGGTTSSTGSSLNVASSDEPRPRLPSSPAMRQALAAPIPLRKANSDTQLTSNNRRSLEVKDAALVPDVSSGAEGDGAAGEESDSVATSATATGTPSSPTSASANMSASMDNLNTGTARLKKQHQMLRARSSAEKGGLGSAGGTVSAASGLSVMSPTGTVKSDSAAAAAATALAGPELRVMYLSEGGQDKMILQVAEDEKVVAVMAGTPEKLVERLADEARRDEEYVWTFLLTFRPFIKPVEVFEILLGRFNMVKPADASKEDEDYFNKWKRPIMTMVINTVLQWMEWHYQDFDNDPKLEQALVNFIQNLGASSYNIAKGYLQQMRETQSAACKARKASMQGPPPKSFKKRLDSIVPTTKARVLAEQITLYDGEIFAKVTPIEFIYTIWPPPDVDREEHSPMLSQLINRFDTESYWVATEVCGHGDPSMQCEMIRKFIKVAHRCLELNNYYSMFAVMGGLSFPPIRRMKAAWEMLGEKDIRRKEQIEKIMNPSRNMRAYRDAIAAVPKGMPAVPFLPVYMKDLVFINDGNEKRIEGMVNFDKLRMLANVVSRLRDFQKATYAIPKVTEVLSYLEGTKITRDIDKLTSELATLTERWKQQHEAAMAAKGSIRGMML